MLGALARSEPCEKRNLFLFFVYVAGGGGLLARAPLPFPAHSGRIVAWKDPPSHATAVPRRARDIAILSVATGGLEGLCSAPSKLDRLKLEFSTNICKREADAVQGV